MYSHEIQIRVRYGETDQMGFLYYGNYALYYEVGRVEALRSLGVVYKDLEERKGLVMPVLSVSSQYLYPARYDELIRVQTIIPSLPKARIQFDYRFINPENRLIHEASVVLCFVDHHTNRPIRIPTEIQKVLAPYFSTNK